MLSDLTKKMIHPDNENKKEDMKEGKGAEEKEECCPKCGKKK